MPASAGWNGCSPTSTPVGRCVLVCDATYSAGACAIPQYLDPQCQWAGLVSATVKFTQSSVAARVANKPRHHETLK